jgi:co-chaperonin GroES (HSP10)
MSGLILPTHVAEAREKENEMKNAVKAAERLKKLHKKLEDSVKKQEEDKSAIDVTEMYVKEEDRVLDPSRLPSTTLERMPTPTGWRILILPYRGSKQTKGGVLLADETIERNTLATVVGYVLKVGPEAYADAVKFPTGPWCKKGDWVMIGRYAGTRFRIEGGEVRIINDDEVIATISDPADVLHV